MNILADEVEILTSSVMGVTVGCARCHNHKYDPIPQRDYYRLSAILQAAYNPYEWKTPNQRQPGLALEAERREFETHNAPLDSEIKKIQEQIAKATDPLKAQCWKSAWRRFRRMFARKCGGRRGPRHRRARRRRKGHWPRSTRSR